MKEIDDFLAAVKHSLDTKCFVKITLSKPAQKNGELVNVYGRLAEIKHKEQLSFTYHFKTNDQTKNFEVSEALSELHSLVEHSFQHSRLFTVEQDMVLQITKKGEARINKTTPSFTTTPRTSHNREKIKRALPGDAYLVALGIMNEHYVLVPAMADKFRQINKYLEIIDGLIKSISLPKEINIVDMGSGKGYLTFALYDYLQNKLGLTVTITGIELRKDLVEYCTAVAEACGFAKLKFKQQSIEDFDATGVDVVIALHACDTATDDALAKAIQADAALIVCAPCCHKQIRQQVKGKQQRSPILKYGIFKERQFEMVTDTIRALILEKKHYETKIFEFISNEHTRKNILLVGTKTKAHVNEEEITKKINSVKDFYQIDYHYLEKLTVVMGK